SAVVSVGDQILVGYAARLERRIGEDHHAAALADQRDRPFTQFERSVLSERDEPALGTDIAHAVRTRYAKPGVGDHGRELAPERSSLAVKGFPESGGEHGRAARARG